MRFSYSPSAMQVFRLAAMLTVIALCAGEAEALGLGELSVRSRLGSRFHAEVQLIESAGDVRLAEQCFRLSSAEGAESGMPVLTRGRINIERENGRARLVITSDQTISEPVLQVNLRAGCGAEVVRSYTALIDPSATQPSATQTSASPPLGKGQPEANKPWQTSSSEGSYPKVWQTTEGESALSITKALFPRQPSAQRRFMLALQRENPQFDFGIGGEAPLEAGSTLSIPDTRRREPVSRLADVDEKLTPKEVRPNQSRLPVRQGKSFVQEPASRMSDRLVISSGNEEEVSGAELSLRSSTSLSMHLSGKVSESARAILRLEYKLLAALYVQAMQQLDIAEQVRSLENGLVELRIASESMVQNSEALKSSGDSVKDAASSEMPPAGLREVPTSPAKVNPSSAAGSFKLEPHKPAREAGSGWWLEILIVLGLVATVTWLLFRRSLKQRQANSITTADNPSPVPPLVDESGKQAPWGTEAEPKASTHAEPSIGSGSSINAAPVASPGVLEYAQVDITGTTIETESASEYSTVMELAEIMVCFGRIKGATQALEEFLENAPGAALVPWLRLLEIYRSNDMREEFDSYSIKLRAYFNVAPASWDVAGECLKETKAPAIDNNPAIDALLKKLPNLRSVPHVQENILRLWDSPEGLSYLKHLLRDTRNGTRSGFPLAVARELLFLADLLASRLQSSA